MATQPDFLFADHGSIILLTPITEAALDWVAAHIPDDAQTFGGGIAIEHRYWPDIIWGINDDGLTVTQ